jgi:hypothetical protein
VRFSSFLFLAVDQVMALLFDRRLAVIVLAIQIGAQVVLGFDVKYEQFFAPNGNWL